VLAVPPRPYDTREGVTRHDPPAYGDGAAGFDAAELMEAQMRSWKAGLASVMAVAAIGQAASAADPLHPTVVELYQSQGCSSCPPADLVMNAIADRPAVLALNFAVTYWDQLGWKDTFAQPAFTRRQWDYAKAGSRTEVATPQVIVNGRGVLTGNRAADVSAAIVRYDRGSTGPVVHVAHGDAEVGPGRGGGTVWLVRFDPRTIAVPIGAGENGGRTISHRDIVRELTALGRWNGVKASFRLPPAPPGLASALLVQDGAGGPIIAALRL
jgi:hypothetical protein